MGMPFRNGHPIDGNRLSMRVAVTGASGFVGRHVVSALRQLDASVIAISRHPDAATDDQLLPLAFDIAQPARFSLERIGNPDVLVHLAWGGLPNYRSAHHLEHELPAHSAFLESCVRSGLKRLVVAGTCLEYGMHSGGLVEATPCMPVTAYGKAKCALHQHLQELGERCEFDLTWLRMFYLYGPGQSPASLYSQLRAAVASNERSFDMSAGDQIRDFLPIETAAKYMAELTLGPAGSGAVNICSGQPVSVVDIVRDWLRTWNAEITLNRGTVARPDYEPFAFWGNPGKLKSLLEAS